MAQAQKNKMEDIAKITKREVIFDGYHLVENITVIPKSLVHDGWAAEMKREIFHNNQVASVLLYDPLRDEILLNQQFRLGAMLAGAEDPFLYECSAGAVDDGETPEEAAVREALEETGAVVQELLPIAKFHPSPASVAECFHLYVGRIDSAKAGIYGLAHEGEEIKTHVVTFEKAMKMLDDGHILNGPTIAMLNWFARKRENLRKKWGVV